MNKPLALVFIVAIVTPFVSCSIDETPGRRDTVFHSAEDSPRSGQPGSHRYGNNGTHSPTERSRSNSRRNNRDTARNSSRSRRRSNSDPDGIVKPRGLDPKPDETEQPVIVSNDPEPKKEDPKPDPKPDPAPSSGDVPYAEAVPGKTGLVYSPFVPRGNDALVKVTDDNDVPLPPGTEVQCPITKKNFRVP